MPCCEYILALHQKLLGDDVLLQYDFALNREGKEQTRMENHWA